MKTLTVIQFVAHVKKSLKITELLKFVKNNESILCIKYYTINYFKCETTLNSTIFPCLIFFVLLHYPLWHDIPPPKSFIWVLVNNICKQNKTNLIL